MAIITNVIKKLSNNVKVIYHAVINAAGEEISPATEGSLASLAAAVVAGGNPVAGFETTGDDDNNYNTIVTAPAWECHNLHVAVGNGGVRVSLNGGTDVHFYIPPNVERGFSGLKIPAGSVIKTKKFVDGGTVSTDTAISVW